MIFTKLPKQLNHHAYCLVGDESTKGELIKILDEVHRIPQQANPDFFDRSYETFTVGDARELKSLHDTKPIGETSKKIFVISLHSITIEAQNALLKLLEEPSEYTHFFLVVSSVHLLLSTIKSRLCFIETDKNNSNQKNDRTFREVRSLLKLPIINRLDFVKKLLGDIAKEKKTKQDAVNFLNALERVIYDKKNLEENKELLEKIALVKKYAHDRSPSLKMLLEYVTLLSF